MEFMQMNSCLSSSNSNNGYGYIYDSTEECSGILENSLGFTLHGMMNKIMNQINQHNNNVALVENNIVSTSVPLSGYNSAGSLNFSPHADDNNNIVECKSILVDPLQCAIPEVVSETTLVASDPIMTEALEGKKRLPSASASFKKVKKVVHWSRNEHMRFLKGLLDGKDGKWKEISNNYVKTKTPSQVASHAQKYEKRQKQKLDDDSKKIKRKPRPSIHDITILDLLSDDSYTWSFDQDDNNNDRSLPITIFNQECDQDVVAST